MSGGTRQIAMYGKGGVGKSTVVSNLAAAMARSGLKVLQIGCDPKRDSTRTHLGGATPPTVLDKVAELGSVRKVVRQCGVEDLVRVGHTGVHCVEAGGPEPGVGCAGRGIVLTMEALTEIGVFEAGYDVVFYDVLGDVVCGGFAMPIRRGYAEEVYLVVSGEFLPLYAANNISRGIARYARTGQTRLAGMIGNLRGTPGEKPIVERFAAELGTSVLYYLSRSPEIVAAEAARKTVIEHAPDSAVAARFVEIAEQLLARREPVVPQPLDDSQVERIVLEARGAAV